MATDGATVPRSALACPAGGRGAWRAESPGPRRWLQLGLAARWLLDGLLQYQSVMFTRAFGQMLAATAPGNPALIATPITWAARIIEHHPVPTNAAFATIQLLIGLGIAWRPAVRAALAASIIWSAAVWWFGEGLGGILNGGASPVNGAPGAVILYALLAVLLWPARADDTARADESGRPEFVAARPAGATAARALWLVLWGSLACFAVTTANRSPQGLHDMVAGMAVSLIIWVAGQALGGMLAGGATDPDSGPLLVLLALAYWPAAASRQAPGSAAEPAP